MSNYRPPAVPVADLNIAEKPALALDFKAYLSDVAAAHLADINLAANASGVMEAFPAGALALSAEPSAVQCVVTDHLDSDAQVVVTFAVTDEDDGPTTATATFAPPGWVKNQSFSFQEGYGVDLVVANGKNIKSISSLTSVTNAKRGSKFKLLKLPDIDTFSLVGCTTERQFTTKSRPSVPIPCGADGSAFNARGRSKPGELTIAAKYVTYADGLARFAGRECTAMLILEKSGAVVTDRLVFTSWIPEAEPTTGDGDDQASISSKGMYEHFAAFIAPAA